MYSVSSFLLCASHIALGLFPPFWYYNLLVPQRRTVTKLAPKLCRSRTGSFVLDLLYIHLKTQQYPEAPKTLNIPVYTSKGQLVGRQLVFNRHHPNILFGHEIYLARRHFSMRNKESPELTTAQQDTKRQNLLKRVFSRLGFRRGSSLARTKKDANVTSTEVKGLGQETNIANLIAVVVTKF